MAAAAVSAAAATGSAGAIAAASGGRVEASGAASDRVRVAVVIDFAGGGHRTRRVLRKCLRLAPGGNGTAALLAVTTALRVAPPTYAASGLLCSIGGDPAQGCGTETSNGYAYWSYWHGGTHWTYASVGPASWSVADGDVEGWRFERDGSATPADPPPSGAAAFDAICAMQTAAQAAAPGRSDDDAVLAAGLVAALVVLLGGGALVRWRRSSS